MITLILLFGCGSPAPLDQPNPPPEVWPMENINQLPTPLDPPPVQPKVEEEAPVEPDEDAEPKPSKKPPTKDDAAPD